MQRLASIWPGAMRASVGQASMQRRQVPQRSAAGVGRLAAATSSEVTMQPRKSHRPELLVERAGVFGGPADAGLAGVDRAR